MGAHGRTVLVGVTISLAVLAVVAVEGRVLVAFVLGALITVIALLLSAALLFSLYFTYAPCASVGLMVWKPLGGFDLLDVNRNNRGSGNVVVDSDLAAELARAPWPGNRRAESKPLEQRIQEVEADLLAALSLTHRSSSRTPTLMQS